MAKGDERSKGVKPNTHVITCIGIHEENNHEEDDGEGGDNEVLDAKAYFQEV